MCLRIHKVFSLSKIITKRGYMKLCICLILCSLIGCARFYGGKNKFISEHPEIDDIRSVNDFPEMCSPSQKLKLDANAFWNYADLANEYLKYLVAQKKMNTYKVITQVSVKNLTDGEARIAYCPPKTFASLSELEDDCENKDGHACFRIGVLKMKENGASYLDFLSYFEKSCNYGYESGCDYYKENNKRYEELLVIQGIDAKCMEKNDVHACLDLMMIFRKKKLNPQAHPYAEKACFLRDKIGCEFMKAIEGTISMDAQRKEMERQTLVLEKRNSLLGQQIFSDRASAESVAGQLSNINFQLNLMKTYGQKK
jgi:hypothetical protein